MKLYNFGANKIGDKIASAYLLTYYATQKNEEFLLIDPSYNDHKSFPIKQFFPQLPFVLETNAPIPEGITNNYRHFQTHNLWISAPSLKQDTGYVMKMEIPDYIKNVASGIVVDENRRKLSSYKNVIINHPLIDAPYNTARNVDIIQWKSFMDGLRDKYESEDTVIIDLPIDYSQSVQHLIAIMSLGTMFIGCDTGFSHIYSAMYPFNPMIGIYPDERPDREAFEHERISGKFSHSWCSDPVNSQNFHKFILDDHKFDEQAVSEKIEELMKL